MHQSDGAGHPGPGKLSALSLPPSVYEACHVVRVRHVKRSMRTVREEPRWLPYLPRRQLDFPSLLISMT